MRTTRAWTLPRKKICCSFENILHYHAKCNHDIPWINYGITACSNLFGITSTLADYLITNLQIWKGFLTFTTVPHYNLHCHTCMSFVIYQPLGWRCPRLCKDSWKKHLIALSCSVSTFILFWTQHLEPNSLNLILATLYLKHYIWNLIIASWYLQPDTFNLIPKSILKTKTFKLSPQTWYFKPDTVNLII